MSSKTISIGDKIIVCSECKGKGLVYWEELVGYHNGDYASHSKDCKRCNNRGVVMQTTTVKVRALTDKEVAPRRSHNGKYSHDR